MKEQPSPFPYESIMTSVSNFQGNKSAVVILQNEDGSTTYLRHNISEEDVAKMLRAAYCSPNTEHERPTH